MTQPGDRKHDGDEPTPRHARRIDHNPADQVYGCIYCRLLLHGIGQVIAHTGSRRHIRRRGAAGNSIPFNGIEWMGTFDDFLPDRGSTS